MHYSVSSSRKTECTLMSFWYLEKSAIHVNRYNYTTCYQPSYILHLYSDLRREIHCDALFHRVYNLLNFYLSDLIRRIDVRKWKRNLLE